MDHTHSHARRQQAPPPVPPRSGGINIGTLIAAAVASVVAALVVSRFWQSGTIMATAMTPVIVAVVKEMVERPARRVSTIASQAPRRGLRRVAATVAEPAPEAYAPPPPIPDGELSEVRVYGRARMAPGRRWKLAVATGLLAFAIGVGVLTLPELVAGRSVTSGGHDTTIFGGRRVTHRSTSGEKTTTSTDKQNTTTTDTAPQGTTSTQTAPPAATTTTPAPTTRTPAPAAPQSTAPAQPQSTTPAAPPATSPTPAPAP